MKAEIRRLLEQWRQDADAIDADGDLCCALTRRHDADQLESLLALAAVPAQEEGCSRLIELSDKHRHDGGEIGELIALFEAQILADYYRARGAPAAPHDARETTEVKETKEDTRVRPGATIPSTGSTAKTSTS